MHVWVLDHFRNRYGFLLKQEGDTYTILFTTTLIATIRIPQKNTRDHCQRVNIATFPDEWLKKHEHTGSAFYSPEIDAFMFAYFYATRRDMRSANKFYPNLASPPQTSLEGHFLQVGEHHLKSLLFVPSISREQILEQATLMANRFQKGYGPVQVANLKAFRNQLAKMVQEDRQLRLPALPSFNKLPLHQQITELIFQLRDAIPASEGFLLYTYPEPFRSDKRYHANRELLRIGYPAIPQLIEAFDDSRFTRSTSTIGKMAEELFTEITAKSFNNNSPASRNAVKQMAREWWQQFQQKGERAGLIQMVSQGDFDSAEACDKLAQKYPQEVLPAIKTALSQSRDPQIHESLMERVAKQTGEQALEFAQSAMWHGISPRTRLIAATYCWTRGDVEALNAVLDLWKRRKELNMDESECDPIVMFLGNTHFAKAVQTIDEDVVSHNLIDDNVTSFLFSCVDSRTKPPIALTQTQQADFERALEQLLIHVHTLLPQRDFRVYQYHKKGSTKGRFMNQGRLCDVAGVLLFLMKPKKYQFDAGVIEKIRDAQRLKNINTWNREHHLPELTLLPN